LPALGFGVFQTPPDVTQLLPFIGYARTLNGLRAVDEITGDQ